uniref:PIG-L family deacetylase n=1 Tax=Eiseniibacteriota bacterium TaxID=2212470 RepID=A0A832I3H5_UNCEI
MRRSLAPFAVTAALAAALLACAPAARAARPPDPMDAAEIRLALRKLQVLGTAMYITAHPDDENTAFLAYLSKGRLVRTVTLTLTRGDGGQNLIGPETGEALGVIRTQELLAARRMDGAEQAFTRALDFGYSKGPDETLALWGREETLADVVWAIRRWRPDVLVTRFGTDGSGGHGHHTASAILAAEAFAAAGDPARFPEQLRHVEPWAPKRLLWNNWRPRLEGRDAGLPPILEVDLGAYSPLLGKAYTEIAGLSRSQHKSQGFGAPERRGSIPNWFEPLAGEPARADLFDGVDLGWSRVRGGPAVGALIAEAERAFDPDRPAAILPLLVRAHAALRALAPEPIVEAKLRDLREVIRSCAGLWVEAIAAAPQVSPGGRVRVTLTALNRSSAALTLDSVALPFGAVAKSGPSPDSAAAPEPRGVALADNRPFVASATLAIPADAPVSQPYWLTEPAGRGRFVVRDPLLIGTPENAPVASATFVVAIGGERIPFEAPVVYRWTDPVEGERYRHLEVAPPLTARFDQPAYVFADARPRELRVVVQAGGAAAAGTLRLRLPAGWRAAPAEAAVSLPAQGETSVRFSVTPGAEGGTVSAEIVAGGRTWSHRLVRLDHPHIPVQSLFPPAEARLVRADVRIAGGEVGYVMGSGDQVPEALRQLGFRVTLLSDDDLEAQTLARYDAIVVGVRAYNTRPRLRALQPRLLDYVAGGGRLVVQYHTAERGLGEALGPRPFTISRERVSVEDAEVRLARPGHVLLTAPNRIGPADFAGWVQERGLYFASPYDSTYDAVLSSNDPGEPPRDGGLLYARHGRGVFIYTGLAFFRQLPAGVPGAYRLFANLVSREGRR